MMTALAGLLRRYGLPSRPDNIKAGVLLENKPKGGNLERFPGLGYL